MFRNPLHLYLRCPSPPRMSPMSSPHSGVHAPPQTLHPLPCTAQNRPQMHNLPTPFSHPTLSHSPARHRDRYASTLQSCSSWGNMHACPRPSSPTLGHIHLVQPPHRAYDMLQHLVVYDADLGFPLDYRRFLRCCRALTSTSDLAASLFMPVMCLSGTRCANVAVIIPEPQSTLRMYVWFSKGRLAEFWAIRRRWERSIDS